MKWLLRTLIIVVAALLVSAATSWIAPNVMSTRNIRGGDRGPAITQQNTGNNTANLPAPPRRERGGERGGGIFGLTVLLRSLLQIAIIIVPFAVYSSIKQRRKATRAQLLS